MQIEFTREEIERMQSQALGRKPTRVHRRAPARTASVAKPVPRGRLLWLGAAGLALIGAVAAALRFAG